MGLNERRKIKELQEVVFPGRVNEIEEICGLPIPYEVDWDSLSDDLEGLNFIDNISCHRLNMALRVICQDEMGKQAVREGLKLVKLKNVKDQSAKKIAFSAGVLEMHCPYAQGASGMFSDSEIRQVLERTCDPESLQCPRQQASGLIATSRISGISVHPMSSMIVVTLTVVATLSRTPGYMEMLFARKINGLATGSEAESLSYQND